MKIIQNVYLSFIIVLSLCIFCTTSLKNRSCPVYKNIAKETKIYKIEKAPVIKSKRKPVQMQKRRGTLPSRGFIGKRSYTVETTAYCPCRRCCGKATGITASGMRAGYGIIAVDTRYIKFGTKVYVEGYGLAIAADTGGAIKGRRIDVCFPSHSEALRWGRKNVKITIY